MRVSTFFAATLPEAMAKVREALGPKAIVLSWRNTRGGVEISASVNVEPVAAPRPEPAPAKHLDLLADHFAPDDFLPTPRPVKPAPEPPQRGLAALVGRQNIGKSDPKAPPPRAGLPYTASLGRGAVGQAHPARNNAIGNVPPPPGPLPTRGMGSPQISPAPYAPSPHSGEGGSTAASRPLPHKASEPKEPSRLAQFLVRTGLTLAQAETLAGNENPNLRRALTDTINQALTFDPIAAVPTKPLILVGPPGSGKSTCAAKLAARTIASGHEVLLVSADSERCGGADQLKALAHRLGARFDIVTTLADLNELVNEARQRGMVVFIDAPSASPAQPADMRAIARMMDETRLEAVLCLPADMRADDQEDLVAAYEGLGVKRAIATRLDLTNRRASILIALKQAEMSLAQVSATPYISGGVAIATAQRVAGLLLEPFEDALAEDAA